MPSRSRCSNQLRAWNGLGLASLLLLAACQEAPRQTGALIAAASTVSTPTVLATSSSPDALRPPSPTIAAESSTPEPTATMQPTATPTSSPPTATQSPTSSPVPPPSPSPAPTASSPNETFGRSVQGRPIVSTRIGNGAVAVAFVGDTHGAPERATDLLIQDAIVYYRLHPSEVPAVVTAYFIPTLNPDGLALGVRQNAHGVDLNRNFGSSDWETNAYEPGGLIVGGGGPRPFTEPESVAMRDFLVSHHIAASIFYHLPWGGVFSEPRSIDFARQVATASGYPFHLPGQGTPYRMTGTAHRWADEHGELSTLLELRSNATVEWDANRRGIDAAMAFAAPPPLTAAPSPATRG